MENTTIKIISVKEFGDFLRYKPLYGKIIAVENFYNRSNTFSNISDFQDKPFKFLCTKENEVHTFKTTVQEYSSGLFGDLSLGTPHYDKLPSYFNKTTKMLDLTIFLKGICSSCGNETYFLIKVYSNKSYEKRDEGINIYIQKVGQSPPFEIDADDEVTKYFSEEDKSNYKKALASLSVSFGIGAFAYFRRIIENEIKKIIKDLSESDFDGAESIKSAYKDYEKNHQMSNLIQEIYNYLPVSLRQYGDNPIKLLHDQLSGGIHEFTEEQCLQKSEQINLLLPYVIKKVNEEKFENKNIKIAMQKLRNNKI